MNAERREAVRLAAIQSLSNLGLLSEVIADAVEAGISWLPSYVARTPEQWSCGCDSRDCVIRRDRAQDAGVDPYAIVSCTCITHALVGRSRSGRVRDELPRLEAQAMLNLDLAHQEQCR